MRFISKKEIIELENKIEKLESELKQLYKDKKELKEKIQNFERIFDTFKEPIIIIDLEGNIRNINGEASRFFDISKSELLKKNFFKMIDNNVAEKICLIHKKHKRIKKTFETSIFIGNGNENEIPVELNIEIFTQKNNEYLLIEIKEITNIINIKKEKEKLKEKIEQDEKEYAETISLISHDLESPMSDIMGAGKILKRDYQNIFDDDGNFYLEQIIKTAQDLEKLMKYLLLFLSKEEYYFKKFEILEVINSIYDSYYKRLKKKNIEMDFNYDFPTIFGNEQLIKIAIRNLIDNSIKYMERPLGGKISVRWEDNGKKILFCIEDNGRGIPPTELKSVFDLSFRGKRAIKEEIPGYGAGLTLVKKILEIHDEQVWIKSKPGEYTKVFFRLKKPIKNNGGKK